MPFLGSGLLGSGLGVSGGSRLIGATWAVDGNGRGYNTPSVGAELLTDGGLENWNSATDLTSWVESVTGASTVNQESTEVNSGTYSARLTGDSSNNQVYIQQNASLLNNTWYLMGVTAKTDVLGKQIAITTNLGGTSGQSTFTLTTDWVQYIATRRHDNAVFNIKRVALTSASAYIDNVTAKQLTTATLLAYTQGTATDTPLARINAIATNTQAGVIGWCDNPANPQNFVIAIRNGSGSVNLTKCVAGTYTNLISSSVTFVADAAIEIRRPSGNTFQLWYNGSQVGTDQTISDAAIANNSAPYFGPFSTYSGNTFTSFSLAGVDIPFSGA